MVHARIGLGASSSPTHRFPPTSPNECRRPVPPHPGYRLPPASGLVNLVTPTLAVVTGGLDIGRINFAVCSKFVALWVVLLAVLVMVVLSAGAIIGA